MTEETSCRRSLVAYIASSLAEVNSSSHQALAIAWPLRTQLSWLWQSTVYWVPEPQPAPQRPKQLPYSWGQVAWS